MMRRCDIYNTTQFPDIFMTLYDKVEANKRKKMGTESTQQKKSQW